MTDGGAAPCLIFRATPRYPWLRGIPIMDDTVNGLATVITAEMSVTPGFARALAVRLLTVLIANGWKPPEPNKS